MPSWSHTFSKLASVCLCYFLQRKGLRLLPGPRFRTVASSPSPRHVANTPSCKRGTRKMCKNMVPAQRGLHHGGRACARSPAGPGDMGSCQPQAQLASPHSPAPSILQIGRVQTSTCFYQHAESARGTSGRMEEGSQGRKRCGLRIGCPVSEVALGDETGRRAGGSCGCLVGRSSKKTKQKEVPTPSLGCPRGLPGRDSGCWQWHSGWLDVPSLSPPPPRQGQACLPKPGLSWPCRVDGTLQTQGCSVPRGPCGWGALRP